MSAGKEIQPMRLSGQHNQRRKAPALGLTIHYEGRLKSEDALGELLSRAKAFARKRGWPFEIINDAHRTLDRFVDDSPELEEEASVYKVQSVESS